MEFLTCDYFTLTSDVWSFGVVLWEMLSCGRVPYGQQLYKDVLEQLEKGDRLPCPTEIKNVTLWNPEALYEELSAVCFKEDPDARATFANVVECIESKLSKDEISMNEQMDEEYMSSYCRNYLNYSQRNTSNS